MLLKLVTTLCPQMTGQERKRGTKKEVREQQDKNNHGK